MRNGERSVRLSLLLVINGIVSLMLLMMAVWRENPDFWRNSGGYSVGLRELVYLSYYPLLAVVGAANVTVSFIAIRHFLTTGRGWTFGLIVVGEWLLFVTILTVMLWNNVTNWLEGRPLHYHPAL